MSHELLSVGAYDGRYRPRTREVSLISSQYAFTRNRIIIGATHFMEIIKQFKLESHVDLDKWKRNILDPFDFDTKNQIDGTLDITKSVSYKMVEECIELEKTTNHDVGAIIAVLRQKYDQLKIGPKQFKGFIHLGLTSQDLNSSANMISLNEFKDIWMIHYHKIVNSLLALGEDDDYLMGMTHGQSATPTTIKHIMDTFTCRLNNIMSVVSSLELQTKFGGATGGFNSLHALDLGISWTDYADRICDKFHLKREQKTSQVMSHDSVLLYLSYLLIFNQILYDMSLDMWHYISREVLVLKVVDGEVGSSAMPHKVNPIHFENAMGNISICNGFIQTMQTTLPVSIMQRDLRDSTILRQLGNLFSSSLVAWKSIATGLERLKVNHDTVKQEINNNIVVVVEGLQTVLRFCGNNKAYDEFKEMTRGKPITHGVLHEFVNVVDIDSDFIKVVYDNKKSVEDVRQLMRNIIDKPEVYFTNVPIPK